MSQTQTPTKRLSDPGDMIDYTPGSAVYGGDTIVLGSMVCVALLDIAASALGALCRNGPMDGPKDASTFAAGDPVYWNPTGDPTVGTAGTGCYTSTAVGTYFAGTCLIAAATGAARVYFALAGQAQSAATVGQGRDPINTAISTAGAGTLTAAALVGGVITRTGPTAAYTDTTATAALILAAIPGAAVGESWYVFIKNTVPYTGTLAAGTDVTLAGQTLIPPNSVGVFLVTKTAATTVTMRGVGVAAMTALPPETNTAISTVGAGTLTAAGIVGRLITRSGSTADYTDTTATAAQIIAALPNANVGDSFEFTIKNTVAFAETLAAGTDVTLAGLSVVPPLSVGRFLCVVTAATTVTITGIDMQPLCNLPYSKFTTTAAASPLVAAAGNLTGAAHVVFQVTTNGAFTLTTRTATQMFGDIPNAQIGMSFLLTVVSQGDNTVTVDPGTNVTITGTATVATKTTRTFVGTFTSATALTLQGVSKGTIE